MIKQTTKHLMRYVLFLSVAALFLLTIACQKETIAPFAAIEATFQGRIDPEQLFNYANQPVPAYITKNNRGGRVISDEKATLGRVLFYDKSLSVDFSISCASCHQQAFAFSDTAVASAGVMGGVTARHSMRLINTRFAQEAKFFWDERASTLEAQTTMPIRDHAEMGFSGQNGRPGMDSLLSRLRNIDYYQELFRFVYGDDIISEQRMQESLADFISSIQSFDSKYDVGRAGAPNDGVPFQNFTPQENMGKQLFLAPPVFAAGNGRIGGGFGCQGCHRAPEFDIDPNSRNNGVTRKIVVTDGLDLFVTRSPTLRDVVNATGGTNGPFMHSGVFGSLQEAIGHYNTITVAPGNPNLDPRLARGGNGQRLNMTPAELEAMQAFLRTLSGKQVYTDARWGDPF
jgi:cytochrome c peroxidase